MPRHRFQAITAALLALVLAAAPVAAVEDLKLPNLGESSTSLFSAEYEYQLGRTWLRIFRGQVPTVNDPLLFDYLEGLVFRLVNHSQLKDRRVDLVIVDNPTINAFAVPGGVIGVHNGLLLYAQSEDELATVLAHEIAHLSQRHFSRRVEFQKKQQPLTLATMLASFVLMAAVGGDAGMAALSASQAAAQGSALRYSRGNEAEADRVGMQTLVAAGMDPHAAPSMFERMLQASRYATGNRVPEFLRTHPLSENRIADTRNRARQYPKQIRASDLTYQLMRARVVNQLAETPEEALRKFRSELDGAPRSQTAARYGLVLALTDAGRTDEAALELDTIWAGDRERLEYLLADAEIDLARNRPEKAVHKLSARLELSPDNHPLVMAYARALLKNEQPHIAEQVLEAQSKQRPDDPYLWYLLAEVQGLAGNIVGLHQSRAEYFILNGGLGEAEKQLRYALRSVNSDYTTNARINERLKDVLQMKEQLES
ncbi:M48 family metalloprotease [Pseudohaliea rubra]|uniref:Putative beta-barrel assembly-enhancing protease n=1 Tax=Pseudohaliea rubra DSM 19751 TaxID=1265313 RepID=A0A095VTH6_9GAMM|nr:M48 family metalloprotease [Pseudohaliea rubra]KGE04762.1 Exported zinc metalloprotease YfgC precursor [Pseudohaliea rubra DSM 19751]